jgi:GTPase
MSLFETLHLDGKFKPENDDGNIEYKLRLDLKDKDALRLFVTQMLWRLNEGKTLCNKYEAHYLLGVSDDGTYGRISKKELDNSIEIFKTGLKKANAVISIDEYHIFDKSYIFYAKIRKNHGIQNVEECTTIFVGPDGSGKTSLISRLTYDQEDDGNGYSRQLIFRHEYEKQTGTTTSIKKEIIGFKDNSVINYSTGIGMKWEEIAKKSDKLINLYDIPGSLKHIKKTFYGVSGINADKIYIVFSVNEFELMEEQIKCIIEYASLKKIPVKILINKIDLVDKTYNLEIINNYINKNIGKYDILYVSSVTSSGINDLYKDLNKTTKIKRDEQLELPMFVVNNTYYISDTGFVLAGIMESGTIGENDDVVIYDDILGITKAKIGSVYKKQITHESISSGESGSIHVIISETEKKLSMSMLKNCIVTNKMYKPIFRDLFKMDFIPDISRKEMFYIGRKYTVFTKNNIFSFILNSITNTKIDCTVLGIPVLIYDGYNIVKDDLNNCTIMYF